MTSLAGFGTIRGVTLMDVQGSPITVSPTSDGFHVAVTGPIHANTAALEGAMQKVAAAKPKLVQLDLSKMKFISSGGVGLLVAFRRAIVQNGGTLKITAIQKYVLGTLRHAHLDKVFAVDDSVACKDDG
jgi:anti-anti-sigma factor